MSYLIIRRRDGVWIESESHTRQHSNSATVDKRRLTTKIHRAKRYWSRRSANRVVARSCGPGDWEVVLAPRLRFKSWRALLGIDK